MRRLFFALVLLSAPLFAQSSPYWVIQGLGPTVNGYLSNPSGMVTPSLSAAVHYATQAAAQTALAQIQRHWPSVTWTVEQEQ